MRILLVEDERALSDALVILLKHNNYAVDAVYNGQDATDYLKSDIYDLAILDVMIPKKDGISVLKGLRTRGSRIPVIMLTAKSETDDKIIGLDSGADDYITKPFETRELIARIRAVARRKDAPCDNVLSFGNLTLNRAAYEISANGNTAKLGHKEFQILEMLMIKPDNIISAERFMEKIWDYDSEAEMSVVWVYLSQIRKKLAALKADVRIKSNRNIGYSLEKEDD